MTILTIRTDKPEAEIGLYEDDQKIDYKKWTAHRQLAETLHKTIQKLLTDHKLEWQDIQGIVFYQGPGSFTGLRIGAASANALSLGNNIPAVAKSGPDWIAHAVKALSEGEREIALPEYGSTPHITSPKK